ncbi:MULTISPECIES: hydrogenase formation protein HypD [unclassified Butyrivibrio]|uniref:hydrogenase formation protein HypD n=1 Tax=unclassified Butyrivibrio TaxID=2639466 RepID=UPI00041C4A7F|nr:MULTISPECIES: hydrogenase formation protein HypD [unclassified Butyrivibrio]
MDKLEYIKEQLKNYDGEELRFMEVCGTHTAAISENGIPNLLSPKIHLISGPGCPVCVTVTAVIDRLCELSMTENTYVLTFGDLIRVRGSKMSLADARAEGGHVEMLYSPMDAVKMAIERKDRNYVFAAIGFETTTPVYAMVLEEAIRQGVRNLKLLTSLKTMPEVIRWVCNNTDNIDGFLAPGHVSVVTGSKLFKELSEELDMPFVVAGFEGQGLLAAIYALMKLKGHSGFKNMYKSVVTENGNGEARRAVSKYFEKCDASWRGMGLIPGSGMRLKEEFLQFDAGSYGLDDDHMPPGCSCAKVLTGEISPDECPLFGKMCSPQDPHGACMVSTEGSCYNYFISGRTKR